MKRRDPFEDRRQGEDKSVMRGVNREYEIPLRCTQTGTTATTIQTDMLADAAPVGVPFGELKFLQIVLRDDRTRD